jgi:hypothetical protein
LCEKRLCRCQCNSFLLELALLSKQDLSKKLKLMKKLMIDSEKMK